MGATGRAQRPSSSFVPVLQTPPRRGFSLRMRERDGAPRLRAAAVRSCGLDRAGTGSEVCCLPSFWRYRGRLSGRVGPDARARYRPRSADPLPDFAGSSPSHEWSESWFYLQAPRPQDRAGTRFQFRPHGDGRRCVTLLYALHQFFACSMFLFRAIRNLNSGQCRVPPSPPAIRDMKKPWQRKLAGASDSQAPHSRAGMGV